MGKKSKKAASNKRLEALIRAQQINRILQSGNIQSQALLDSAGESRPSDESHVEELLENERFPKTESSGSRMKRRKPALAKKTKSGPSKKRR